MKVKKLIFKFYAAPPLGDVVKAMLLPYLH